MENDKMIGPMIIGIATGMAAAATALASGHGILAAMGLYALTGSATTLAAAFLAIRGAEGRGDWTGDSASARQVPTGS